MTEAGYQQIEEGVRRLIANAILYNHAVAQELGLGPSDAQFVGLLQRYGPMSPGRLAELSGLSTGTVTGVLDRLEKKRLTRREPDPSDRRKLIVTLNEQQIARQFGPHYEPMARQLAAAIEPYSPDQLRTISDFLTRLVETPPPE